MNYEIRNLRARNWLPCRGGESGSGSKEKEKGKGSEGEDQKAADISREQFRPYVRVLCSMQKHGCLLDISKVPEGNKNRTIDVGMQQFQGVGGLYMATAGTISLFYYGKGEFQGTADMREVFTTTTNMLIDNDEIKKISGFQKNIFVLFDGDCPMSTQVVNHLETKIRSQENMSRTVSISEVALSAYYYITTFAGNCTMYIGGMENRAHNLYILTMKHDLTTNQFIIDLKHLNLAEDLILDGHVCAMGEDLWSTVTDKFQEASEKSITVAAQSLIHSKFWGDHSGGSNAPMHNKIKKHIESLARAILELLKESRQDVPNWLNDCAEQSSPCGGDQSKGYDGYDFRRNEDHGLGRYGYGDSSVGTGAATFDEVLGSHTAGSFGFGGNYGNSDVDNLSGLNNGASYNGNIKDIEYEDQETEDEDLNPTTENSSDDDDVFSRIGKPKTNAAGESYFRMGDYVYVLGSEKEVEHPEYDIDCCPICFGLDHSNMKCPWLVNDHVPSDKDVGPLYDIMCKGCGKRGHRGCPEGVRPVLRRCFNCFGFGHWMDKCNAYLYKPLSEFPQYP